MTTEANSTRVLKAIEVLGVDATTKAIAAATGLSLQTVDRAAAQAGYRRVSFGGPWVARETPGTTFHGSNEVVEALNRMAEALEARPTTGTIRLRPGATQADAREATEVAGDASKTLDQRYAAIDTIASFLLADTLQN